MGYTNQTAPSRERLLWAFCRVLANETRLRLLFEIIQSAPLSVDQLSARIGILKTSASMHLKELHTYGLISPNRRKQSVYYALRIEPPEIYPNVMLPILIHAAESKANPTSMVHTTTALTHQRRVEIIRMLSHGPQTTNELLDSSNIKRSALNRHLIKLIDRKFVVYANSNYCLHAPESALSAALLDIALHQTPTDFFTDNRKLRIYNYPS